MKLIDFVNKITKDLSLFAPINLNMDIRVYYDKDGDLEVIDYELSSPFQRERTFIINIKKEIK